MEAPRPLHLELEPILAPTELFWILGNHDIDSQESYSNLVESQLADRDLCGRVVTLVSGLRVAALGGVFRGEIWTPPAEPNCKSFDGYVRATKGKQAPHDSAIKSERYARLFAGKLLKHRSSIFPQTLRALATQRADVLITHEAPSCHPHGWNEIDKLARAMRVRLVVHGHHHDSLPYPDAEEKLGFSMVGVGLPGITAVDADLNTTVIRPGELDHQGEYQATQGAKNESAPGNRAPAPNSIRTVISIEIAPALTIWMPGAVTVSATRQADRDVIGNGMP